MNDTRKTLDEAYRRIAQFEQEIEYQRARIRHEQSHCFHDKRTGDWCDDCDKYLR